jgi:biotin carboxylase
MAHLLIIELPGGNDTDILEAALRMGHTFVFLTQGLDHYRHRPEVLFWIDQATQCIECHSFDMAELNQVVWKSHQKNPFDGILCLIDIRLIEAAELAQSLGLRHLNSRSARWLRDKFTVRERLRQHHLAQPDYRLATTNSEIQSAVGQLGLPILIKPSDGYGSQNILTIETELDWSLAQEGLMQCLPLKTDYGLGVQSNCHQ